MGIRPVFTALAEKSWPSQVQLVLFSSPDHEVLRVSYCDSAVCIVRLASSVINFLACVCSRGHIFSLIGMKFGQDICHDESQMSLKMGHVESKTRSLGQILEKPCVRSRGHTFSPIIMKLGQTLCFDEITHQFKKGYCWVKN